MNISFRIIADIVTLLLLFIAPWWLTLVLICAGLFLFESFYEALFFAVLLDGYQGLPGLTFYGTNLLFTLVVSAVFLVSIFLKTRLKFYSQ